MNDEDLRKQDVETQISVLKTKLRHYEKKILHIQTMRGVALLIFFLTIGTLILVFTVLYSMTPKDILIMVSTLVLLIIYFDIKPRQKGVFQLIKKYILTAEIRQKKNNYDTHLLQTINEIKALEEGYYLATKEQVMSRLRL